ncbi:MAG: alkyl sulfatase, partial [Deltaproteobacteria bacterium]
TTTARALRWLEDEVVRRLNEGQWYEEIVQAVDLPDDLRDSPYLRPVYGCPTFAVHAILRRYTGWYDGNPSNLFPSARADVAQEVLGLAGGPANVLERARALAAEKQRDALQRALHLVDFAIDGGGGEDAAAARRLKAELLAARAEQETSFISRNILKSAALLESEAVDAGT